MDNPFYHALESDPRKEVRDLHGSTLTTYYTLAEWLNVVESNQATVFEANAYWQEMTTKILNGEFPHRRQIDYDLVLMTGGHFLRLNDVLTDTTDTYLSRLMASGVVNKIYGKYQLSDGKQNFWWLQLHPSS